MFLVKNTCSIQLLWQDIIRSNICLEITDVMPHLDYNMMHKMSCITMCSGGIAMSLVGRTSSRSPTTANTTAGMIWAHRRAMLDPGPVRSDCLGLELLTVSSTSADPAGWCWVDGNQLAAVGFVWAASDASSYARMRTQSLTQPKWSQIGRWVLVKWDSEHMLLHRESELKC